MRTWIRGMLLPAMLLAAAPWRLALGVEAGESLARFRGGFRDGYVQAALEQSGPARAALETRLKGGSGQGYAVIEVVSAGMMPAPGTVMIIR